MLSPNWMPTPVRPIPYADSLRPDPSQPANSRNVSTQKKHLDPKGTVLTRLNLNRITHASFSRSHSIVSVVHSALARYLFDRRGAGLEFGKLEVIKGDRSWTKSLVLKPSLVNHRRSAMAIVVEDEQSKPLVYAFGLNLSQSDSSPSLVSQFEIKSKVVSVRDRVGIPRPPRLSDYQIGTIAEDTSAFVSLWAKSEFMSNPDSSDINPNPNLVLENNDQTLKELATSDMVNQPWCIQYSQLEPAQSYKLKSGLIHLLPKFHGLAGEDLHKHLKEFHMVCSTMRPQGMPKDHIKMKAFPFSLDGAAKHWLYLQPILFNTWGDMKCMFLENFFPTSRTITIRKEICGIRQHFGA
ncbi:hypothetical protein CR513_02318, partial [Mucuna pruriens]